MITPLLILSGPTASGKTPIAIELCRRLNGEIICADSMQIYRRCDIVTAKPTREEQQLVPHHLLNICEPDEQFSAAQWATAAGEIIAQIQSRNRLPIIVGGTGFYLRALLQPQILSQVPPDSQLRAQLQAELEKDGPKVLWERLQQVDASAAERLHPNDSFRVLRALEVARGQRSDDASDLKVLCAPETETPFDWMAFGLEWPRRTLYKRIESRIDAMIEAGAWDEWRGLLNSGVSIEAPALNGVGYRQMRPALNDASLESECVEIWKRDTRRYAKRQMTWFRHQLALQWIEMDRRTSGAAAEIERQWRASRKSE
jgi:tRNA dimethylallyltransferase